MGTTKTKKETLKDKKPTNLVDLSKSLEKEENIPEIKLDDEQEEKIKTTDKKTEQSNEIVKNKKKSAWITKVDNFLINTQSISLREKIFFTKNLGVMIKAGLSLGKSLEALAEQTSNKRFKKVLTDVGEKVKKGQSFATSLESHPKVFNQLFVSMIESGETSGNLENVLKQLHKQMRRSQELISKVRGAMIYPSVVVTAMIGIGIAMMIFIVPKFISIFEEANAELPIVTKLLIKTYDFISQNGLLAIVIITVTLAVFLRLIKTKRGKSILHTSFLKIPVLAPIVKKINLAKFSRTLSSLLKTDIPIVKAFKITAHTLGNIHYKKTLIETANKIKEGENIHTCLAEQKNLFPAVVLQMITVGEDTGSLDTILEEVASFYEEEVDQTMKNLPTIIEPVLMLILGVGVGFMAVAVMMPMYSLGQQF